MFSTLISDTFKFVGQVIGETVHQTSELVSGTGSVLSTVAADIANIPQAIVDGYNQELFEAKPTEPTVTTPVATDATAA